MSFLARLVSDNSGSLGKFEFRHRHPHPPLRKKILNGVRVIVRGYLHVRFDLPGSINFRDIISIPKLGAFIEGHPRRPQVVQLDFTEIISY